MPPPSASLYPAYSRGPNAVFLGNRLLRPSVQTDGANLLQREFVSAAPLSAIGSPVPHSVGLVGLPSVPSKVGKRVIVGVSVIMAPFFSLGSWANKRRQNQGVRAHYLLLALFPDVQKWTAVPGVFSKGWLFNDSRSRVTDTAKIGNFVKALVSHHIAPVFHRDTSSVCLWRSVSC